MTQKLHFYDRGLEFLSACRLSPVCMTELLQFCDAVMDFLMNIIQRRATKL